VKTPLPLMAKFLSAKGTEGKVSFVDRTCVWVIGKMDMSKSAVRLNGTFALPLSTPGGSNVSGNQIVSTSSTLEFTMTAKPVSGLKVSTLEITNQTYKYFKGVKSILKSGDFQIRS